MKLSFETENKLFWQHWNQVCFPMELSPCLLPDLSLGRPLPFFWIWGVHKARGVSWWTCSAWIWVPCVAKENTRNQHQRFPRCFRWPATPKHVVDGWMSLENVLLQDGAEGKTPRPGTTGCSLDRVGFYSTLFPLETLSAPRPLQPRCCNWDMGAWSCPPQQASHEKSSLFQQLKNK